ncbi:hypothetical protein KBI23_17755 [bacterium]|nr:hypothetical protein [bacterium]MBP9806786.1 hypothetical protein [bacterium]
MSNLLEHIPASDRKHEVTIEDLNGNKLSEQAIDILTSMIDGQKVTKSQLSEAFAPVLKDAKKHPLAPAAKMMLDEFQIVDANQDGGVDGKEVYQYHEKNHERLEKAPKIEQEQESWIKECYGFAKSAVGVAGKFMANGPFAIYDPRPHLMPSIGAAGGAVRGVASFGELQSQEVRGATVLYEMLTKEREAK